MNWLHPLIEKIHACKAFPVEQRAALALAANELTALCDQVRPTAPMPDVVAMLGRLVLRWGSDERWLGLGASASGDTVLSMQDKGAIHSIQNPPHDELRRAVVAFFEAGYG
jgi:hypothetical protein